MDQSTFEHELRQIKRRRIEIRSTQATLDLEDLNLEDRQKAIEQVLRSRSNFLPSNLPCNFSDPLDDRNLPPFRNPSGFLDPIQTHGGVRDTRSASVMVKFEPEGKPRERSNVPISGLKTRQEDDDDVVMVSHAWVLRTDHTANGTDAAVTTTHSPCEVLSADSVSRTPSAPPRRSKIVVLKVKYDRDTNRRKTTCLQSRESSILKGSRGKPPSLFHESAIPRNSPSAVSQADTSLYVGARSSSRLEHQTIKSNTLSDSAIDLTCPCLGRNRNCHNCRGTPAVIPEGRLFTSPNPSSPSYTNSSTSSTRILGQRSTSRQTNYQIPAFVEMSDSERRSLELRFLQRITDHLVHVLKPTSPIDDPSTPQLNLRYSLWVERIRNFPVVASHLAETLSSFLRRRPIARENADGIWDGRVVVSACRDLDEFIKAAEQLGAKITARHPVGCCAGIYDSSVGMEIDRAMKLELDGLDRDQCWAGGFQGWLRTQQRRVTNCVDACDPALNLEERKGLVDKWEIA